MVTGIWQILDGLEAALGGEWVTPWCVCKSVCVGQGGFGRSPLNGVSKHTPTTIQALANTHTRGRQTLHITQNTHRQTTSDSHIYTKHTHTYTCTGKHKQRKHTHIAPHSQTHIRAKTNTWTWIHRDKWAQLCAKKKKQKHKCKHFLTLVTF